MTKRRRKAFHAQVFAPRRLRADTRYALHVLDSSREELALGIGPNDRNVHQRDAAPDDPWLSPTKAAIVRECLIRISYASNHTPLVEDQLPEIDLRGLCEDAKLSTAQVDVMVLVGEGWTQRQIASWLGLSQTTVWRYWHHGRGRLAGWLPLAVALSLDSPESEGVFSR